ncbi:MAG: GDSL-type esterase/lipase family protein [Planctomycetes bacterium]|nr:GDSL-type esterase/lipase family protein [Planctomycetota bacterium]
MSIASRAAFAAVLSLSAAAPAQDLLRNGGFEEPGSGVPAGLLMWGDERFKKAEWFTRDTTAPHAGKACLRIHHPAGTAGYLVTSPFDNAIRPEAGTTYTISFWARSDRPGSTPLLRLAAFRSLDPCTEGRIQGSFPLAVDTEWKRFSFSVSEGIHFTRAGAPWISLCWFASTDRQEERTLWLDEVAVEARPAAPAVRALPGEVAARFPAVAATTPFADGAVVSCVGDSITHHGAWSRYLRLFYATRYPERTVTVWNAGICGNVAADVAARFAADVAVRQPTVVALMLGMNDVNGPDYGPGAQPAALAPALDKALAAWRANLGRVLAQARAAKAAVILVTPPPYDQDSSVGGPAKTGKNEALARLVGELRTLAKQESLPLVDHYGILQFLAGGMQRAEPSFSFSPDRVHPNEAGHLVMTYAFLRSQGVAGRVSRVAVDAAAGTVAAERAAVSGLAVTEGGVAFTCRAQGLPFPVDWKAALALDLVPFAAELGREELVVGGLRPGSYALAIAGSAIGSYTAAELAAGIDLGACTATPQYRQALAVAALNDRRAELEVGLRNVVFLESEMAKDRVDAQDPAAAQAWLGRLGNWRKGLVPSYQATRPRAAAVLAEVVDLDRQIHAAAQPAALAYTLTRVP